VRKKRLRQGRGREPLPASLVEECAWEKKVPEDERNFLLKETIQLPQKNKDRKRGSSYKRTGKEALAGKCGGS